MKLIRLKLNCKFLHRSNLLAVEDPGQVRKALALMRDSKNEGILE